MDVSYTYTQYQNNFDDIVKPLKGVKTLILVTNAQEKAELTEKLKSRKISCTTKTYSNLNTLLTKCYKSSKFVTSDSLYKTSDTEFPNIIERLNKIIDKFCKSVRYSEFTPIVARHLGLVFPDEFGYGVLYYIDCCKRPWECYVDPENTKFKLNMNMVYKLLLLKQIKSPYINIISYRTAPPVLTYWVTIQHHTENKVYVESHRPLVRIQIPKYI